MPMEPDPPRPSEPTPEYKRYRARPKLFGGGEQLPKPGRNARAGARGTQASGYPAAGAPVRAPVAAGGAPRGAPQPAVPRRRRRSPGRRRLTRWVVKGFILWVGLSLVIFLASAQIQQFGTDGDVNALLGGAGYPLTSPNNVLILGSDTRSKGTKEPGAQTNGNGRSDSIMLLRVGGGANARLSIARDTLVDIPGSGVQKINAAYAIGGAPLAIRTIETYTGINVHHLIEVSFDDFPDLIDAMGGITYKGGCVVSKINGGSANGGVTVRIKAGKRTKLNGEKALALARTRKNSCNPRENDLTRARRQQRIIGSMKRRALSPIGFVRLPWISWQMPRTFRSDMSGPTLLGVFGAMAVGNPQTRVLGTESGVVPDALKQRQVEAFLRD